MSPAIRFVYVGPELSFKNLAVLQRVIVDGRRWLEQKARRRCGLQGLEAYPTPVAGLNNENVFEWAVTRQVAEYLGDRVVFLVRGTGGFAGGNASVNVAVLGDWCLDELLRIHSNHSGLIFTRNAQVGALLHEALHLFWLNHEDGGIMREFWDWPRCALPQKAIANNDLFGEPLPRLVGAWRWARTAGEWGVASMIIAVVHVLPWKSNRHGS